MTCDHCRFPYMSVGATHCPSCGWAKKAQPGTAIPDQSRSVVPVAAVPDAPLILLDRPLEK